MERMVLRLVGLMAIVLVGEAALPYFVFAAPLGGVVLNIYVAVGFAVLLAAEILARLTQDAARSAYEQHVIETARARYNISRWRAMIIGVLMIVQRILCWPAFMFGLNRLQMWRNRVNVRGQLAGLAAIGLFPFEISISIFLAAAALLATLFALWIGEPSLHARMFLWVLIAATAAKHLSALLNPMDVQQRLRRALEPVIVSYVILTACDLVCLMFAYNGVINWSTGSILSGASMRSVWGELRAFKDVLGAWEHLPANATGYAAALSGLLWLFTLANSLLKIFSTGKRTAEDHIGIALSCAMVGLQERARKALALADPVTREHFELKGLGFVALGDFAAARELIDEYLRQLMLGKPPPSADYAMFEMLDAVATVIPQSPALFDQFIRYGADHGMSDVFLTTFALQARSLGSNPSTLADRIEQGGLRSHFPLGYVAFKWSADEERDAHDFLDSLMEPAAGPARATWRIVHLLVLPRRRLAPDTMRAAASQWLETDLPAIVADGALCVPFERLLLMMQLATAQGLMARLGIPAGAIPAAIAVLEESLGDDPFVRKVRAGVPRAAVPPVQQQQAVPA